MSGAALRRRDRADGCSGVQSVVPSHPQQNIWIEYLELATLGARESDMEYNVVSSDGHVDLEHLPHDLFTSNAPAAWRDRMPHVVESEAGLDWVVDGKYLSQASGRRRLTLTPENEHRMARMAEVGFYDDYAKGTPRPTNVELRLKDMDQDGVDAEVIYGLNAVGRRMLGVTETDAGPSQIQPDRERVAVLFRIYNDWLADFVKGSPERLIGLASIPSHDPEAAATELRRAARMGLRGGVFESKSAAKPLYYYDWDVLWEASAECNMSVSFHGSALNTRRPNPEDVAQGTYTRVSSTVNMAVAQLEGAETLTSIILSGACERYPGFDFVLGECGASWIPYMLDRLDHECADYPGLKMKPSDYWRRQGYTTYQSEGILTDLIKLIGEDNAMWGSDYPHPDGTWPDSQEYIQRDLGKLKDEKLRRKITCDNAARLYGLK